MKRRAFLGLLGTGVVPLAGKGLVRNPKLSGRADDKIRFPSEWQNVPMEFSTAPFWFWIDRLVPPDVKVSPSCNGLRVRHVIKGGIHYYVLFNEGQEEINFRLDLSVKQVRYLLDPETGRHESLKPDAALRISRHALHVLAAV